MMQRLVTPNSRDFRIVRYSRRFVLRWYTAVACKLAIWWWSAKQPPNRRRAPDPPFPTAAAPPAPRFARTPRCRGLWGRTRDDANMFGCLLGMLFGMLTDAQSLGRNCARPDEQMKAFVAQWSERQTFNLNVASSSLAEGVILNVTFLEFCCFCSFLPLPAMILATSQGVSASLMAVMTLLRHPTPTAHRLLLQQKTRTSLARIMTISLPTCIPPRPLFIS